MGVTAEKLMQHLPPFRNERVMIKKDQQVHDIIEQILIAHEKYQHYYDKLAKYFDDDSIDTICNNLFVFLKDNIEYREESEDEQTTALPSAILTLKHGDCKHYSSFTAGILDALKRRGKKINWCYRFCSYNVLSKTPHHVFVVVKKTNGDELWIDAVPGANEITPVWQLDKTVKNSSMPLYDVIGNTNSMGGAIGYTTGEQILHSANKVNPLFVIGRGAFLLMLKMNFRAWAKNIQDLTAKYGRQASDPIGKRWYLFGGDSAPFWSAAAEGSTKKMLGSVGSNTVGVIDWVALTVAAAPIIIAMVGIIKQVSGNTNFDGQTALYPDGTTLPPPGGSTSSATDLLKNPVVLAAGAAGLYYWYSSRKKRVSGKDDNSLLLLLLLGGGAFMYWKSKQTTTAPEATEQLLLTAPQSPALESNTTTTTETNLPVDTVKPIETTPMVSDETYYSGGSGNITTDPVYYGGGGMVTDETYYSGGGGGGEYYLKDDAGYQTVPYEAMM